MTKEDRIPPTHPGKILKEFLEHDGITPYRLAKDIKVPLTRIYDIVEEKRAITADSALRLARYFATTPAFWMGLQSQYELETEEDKLEGQLEEIPVRNAG